MTVNERLMATGDWALELRPDTPHRLTDDLVLSDAGFSALIITRVPVDARQVDEDRLWELAVYSGVYRRQEGRLNLSGPGAAWWAGGEQGEGDRLYAWSDTVTDSGDAVSSLLANYEANIDPIPFRGWASAGTVAGSRTINVSDATLRERMDLICSLYGTLEWRVQADLGVPFGTAAQIYGSTPALFLTPGWVGGPEGALYVAPCEVTATAHLEQYAAYLGVLNDDPTAVYHAAANPYVDVNGNPVRVTVVEESSSTDAADLASMAASLHVGRDTWAWEVAVKAEVPLLYDVAPVGSYIYLYDPDQDVRNLANRIVLRGETVSPVLTRVVGATWPITAGLGVYVRSSADESIIDLTDYVAWEDGAVDLELGLPLPSMVRFLTQGQRRL